MYIGIDPATISGYAISDKNGIITDYGLIKLDQKKLGHKFFEFERQMSDVINDNSIECIFFEYSSHFKSNKVSIAMNGYFSIIIKLAFINNCNYGYAHPSTIKKFSTGSGRASKEDMVKACQQFVNYEVIDHNIADAIHICKYGYNYFNKKK